MPTPPINSVILPTGNMKPHEGGLGKGGYWTPHSTAIYIRNYVKEDIPNGFKNQTGLTLSTKVSIYCNILPMVSTNNQSTKTQVSIQYAMPKSKASHH